MLQEPTEHHVEEEEEAMFDLADDTKLDTVSNRMVAEVERVKDRKTARDAA